MRVFAASFAFCLSGKAKILIILYDRGQVFAMKRAGSTMQLTRAADYAVRVMVHFAKKPDGERILLPDLAKATGAPESFLSKVLQSLAHSGFIASRRGQAGGFILLEKGREATLCDVVEVIDGPMLLNLCLFAGNSCERKPNCPVHPIWKKAQEAMMAVLNTATIAGLAAEEVVDVPPVVCL